MSDPKYNLHLFPGITQLMVIEGSAVRFRAEAWGGPPHRIRAHTVENPTKMAMIPTTAGHYLIWGIEAYKTQTWPTSRIRWGTPLRDMPSIDDVLIEESGGRWVSIRKVYQISRAAILDINFRHYGVNRVPEKWLFNDFGPKAIRYFKDANRNGRRDKRENLSGEMFHTTPPNEVYEACQSKKDLEALGTIEADPQLAQCETAMAAGQYLEWSHGCIHLWPRERDQMIDMGAFERYTPLVIHKYDETVPESWMKP